MIDIENPKERDLKNIRQIEYLEPNPLSSFLERTGYTHFHPKMYNFQFYVFSAQAFLSEGHRMDPSLSPQNPPVCKLQEEACFLVLPGKDRKSVV